VLNLKLFNSIWDIFNSFTEYNIISYSFTKMDQMLTNNINGIEDKKSFGTIDSNDSNQLDGG